MVLPKNNEKIGMMLKSVYLKADENINFFNNSFIVGVNASHVYEIYNSLINCKNDRFNRIDFLDLPNEMEAIGDGSDKIGQEYFRNSKLNFQILVKYLVKSNKHEYELLQQALTDKHSPSITESLMVFIEHFEYAYDNEQLNRVKLNVLQRLVSNPSIMVIISSEISPAKVYEFYEDNIKKAQELNSNSAEKTMENREKFGLLKSDYKQWLHLLGGFYRVTVPIEFKNPGIEPDCLKKELKHGQYLARINNKYQEFFKQMDYCEDYILNVQETSYTYYYAIWNSLTKEERYIIYDIAHDQFVNVNNVDGTIDLLHKGLIVYDHSLRLMNESFTNFVLTKVNGDEALEKELQFTKKGDWSTASAVLLLVIISLIVFISFGKINILNDVNALIGSLAAIFTLLIRMSGIFVM